MKVISKRCMAGEEEQQADKEEVPADRGRQRPGEQRGSEAGPGLETAPHLAGERSLVAEVGEQRALLFPRRRRQGQANRRLIGAPVNRAGLSPGPPHQ